MRGKPYIITCNRLSPLSAETHSHTNSNTDLRVEHVNRTLQASGGGGGGGGRWCYGWLLLFMAPRIPCPAASILLQRAHKVSSRRTLEGYQWGVLRMVVTTVRVRDVGTQPEWLLWTRQLGVQVAEWSVYSQIYMYSTSALFTLSETATTQFAYHSDSIQGRNRHLPNEMGVSTASSDFLSTIDAMEARDRGRVLPSSSTAHPTHHATVLYNIYWNQLHTANINSTNWPCATDVTVGRCTGENRVLFSMVRGGLPVSKCAGRDLDERSGLAILEDTWPLDLADCGTKDTLASSDIHQHTPWTLATTLIFSRSTNTKQYL